MVKKKTSNKAKKAKKFLKATGQFLKKTSEKIPGALKTVGEYSRIADAGVSATEAKMARAFGIPQVQQARPRIVGKLLIRGKLYYKLSDGTFVPARRRV